MRTAYDSILEEFVLQRRYREGRRNELIRAFEANKHLFSRRIACEVRRENEVITQLHVGTAQDSRSAPNNDSIPETVHSSGHPHSEHRIHIEEIPVEPHPNYHFQHPPIQTDPSQPSEPSLSPEEFQILT